MFSPEPGKLKHAVPVRLGDPQRRDDEAAIYTLYVSGLIGSSDVRFFQRVDKHMLDGVRFLDVRLGYYGSSFELERLR